MWGKEPETQCRKGQQDLRGAEQIGTAYAVFSDSFAYRPKRDTKNAQAQTGYPRTGGSVPEECCPATGGTACSSGKTVYMRSFFCKNRQTAQSLVVGPQKNHRPAYEMRLEISGAHMPLYEHVMIARQDLSNTQAEGLIEHFGTVLADNGGKLVDSEYWGVKTMAYKINKNRKGHYAFLRSDAPAPAVQEMERLMRLHDDVMRVLTIKMDEHKELPSVQMQKRDERPERRERR